MKCLKKKNHLNVTAELKNKVPPNRGILKMYTHETISDL